MLTADVYASKDMVVYYSWQKPNVIRNSTEFKASAYVLHDIRQVAALVDLSRNKMRIERQEILDIRQVAAFNFATFFVVGCICAYVRMLLYVCGLCLCICA